MFGPSDPSRHARTLVSCALGHIVVGTAEDLHQAKRAVSRAIQLFMRTGLTRDQAIDQVIAFTQMLGSLE